MEVNKPGLTTTINSHQKVPTLICSKLNVRKSFTNIRLKVHVMPAVNYFRNALKHMSVQNCYLKNENYSVNWEFE